jgi:ribonuclease P protein component
MIRQTFKKKERLTNKITFDNLFTKGKRFSTPPFRLVWIVTTSTLSTPVQLGISVPKKNFNKAVDRNKIKRRIRESYRKHKGALYAVLHKKNTIALMIIYIAKEAQSYKEIESKMIVSLQKLVEKFD